MEPKRLEPLDPAFIPRETPARDKPLPKWSRKPAKQPA